MSANLPPGLSAESQAILQRAAAEPESVWSWLAESMPEMVRPVDTMLAGGTTPEWIMQRKEFFEMPVEVQTCFLNALHWRQDHLRKGSK